MLFLQRMPQYIRPVLTINDETPKLAELTDKLTEIPRVVAVAANPVTSPAHITMFDLKEQLFEVLSTEVRRLQKFYGSRRRDRSTSRSRIRNINACAELCWYHRKFGLQIDRVNLMAWLTPAIRQNQRHIQFLVDTGSIKYILPNSFRQTLVWGVKMSDSRRKQRDNRCWLFSALWSIHQ